MADGAASAAAGILGGAAPWVAPALMGAGAIANVIQGIARSGKAKKLEQKFESLDKALQPVSPEQYAYLNRVRQMQRSMAMGTDPTSAMARRGLAQGLAQTQGNIARVGGGPSTVSGLLRAQQGYGQGMSQIAGNAFQASQGLMQVEQGLIGDIQNAVYGLQMKRRNLAQAEAAQMRQASQDNISAAIGSFAQAATMFPKKDVGDVDMKKSTSFDPMKNAGMSQTAFGYAPQGPLGPSGQWSESSQSRYGGGFLPNGQYRPQISVGGLDSSLGTGNANQNFGLSAQQIDFQAPSRFAGF